MIPRPRLTYANTVSTLALFVALGGASYALVSLPRNSVGSAQLRRGSVGTIELRDHAIRMTDLNKTTRRELRGRRGRPGPQGTPGASAASYWAVMASYGGLIRGDAQGGHDTNGGSGHYILYFPKAQPRDLHGCSFQVTIAAPDTSQPPAGYGTAWSDGNTVVNVQTYNASGTPTDMPFHVAVFC